MKIGMPHRREKITKMFDALSVTYRFWLKKAYLGKLKCKAFQGLKPEEFAILARSSRAETEYHDFDLAIETMFLIFSDKLEQMLSQRLKKTLAGIRSADFIKKSHWYGDPPPPRALPCLPLPLCETPDIKQHGCSGFLVSLSLA
jgi:hypothetical protein